MIENNKKIIVFIFFLSFLLIVMIRYHPYQYAYANVLAGPGMNRAKVDSALDYWGLSYKQALEYILRTDKDKTIKICVADITGIFNTSILRPKDRDRLMYVKNPGEAKYFLTNYRWQKGAYPYKNEYYSIKVKGAKIMAVYKL